VHGSVHAAACAMHAVVIALLQAHMSRRLHAAGAGLDQLAIHCPAVVTALSATMLCMCLCHSQHGWRPTCGGTEAVLQKVGAGRRNVPQAVACVLLLTQSNVWLAYCDPGSCMWLLVDTTNCVACCCALCLLLPAGSLCTTTRSSWRRQALMQQQSASTAS
jgi:hypothetical protein